MFFSRIFIEGPFDTEKVEKLYDALSKEFSDLNFIWREKRDVAYDPSTADNVVIEKDGKNLFVLNSVNSRGVFVMKRTDGKEKEALKILYDNGFLFDEPSSGTAIGCIVLFVLAVLFICTMRPDVAFLIIPLAITLFVGIALYAFALNGIKTSEYTLLNISTIISFIGLLGMAPSSLLTFPLVKYLNQRKVFEIIKSID